jgi:hypothetical protein
LFVSLGNFEHRALGYRIVQLIRQGARLRFSTMTSPMPVRISR